MTEDSELLRQYFAAGSEEAFAELVHRYIGLVYSVALRQMSNDSHLAQDVTQKVFTELAREAAALSRHPALSGWLYCSTQFIAIDLVRSEQRRRARELEAQTMHELTGSPDPALDSENLRPVLDQVMGDLNEHDRNAVMLRFFEGRPFAEVGRKLELTEDAARMRVDRALDKMRALLMRRGITSTTTALALALTNEAGVAAPAGLAATVTNFALSNAAAVTATVGGGAAATLSFLKIMSTTKTIAIAAAVLAIATTSYEYNQSRHARSAAAAAELELQQWATKADTIKSLQAENVRLQDRLAALSAANPAQEATAATAPASGDYMDRLQTLADIQAKGLANVGVPVINKGNGKLQARFSELFNLSLAEKSTLNQAVEQARQKTEQLMAANASVSRLPDGSVLIAVPPVDAGNAVRDELMDAFAHTLGPERYAVFLALQGNGSNRLGSALGDFGTQQRTVTLTRGTSPDGNKSAINIQDKQDNPNGGFDSAAFTAPNAESIPSNLHWALNLVPPDF
ncbi:MAG TPA: sigma-70 family RNA polymerase sigma factor [Opitutaceae bacterium]|nr:sigma-70 family RNA polymerase sigma factor [Opitutaceae bacterium]